MAAAGVAAAGSYAASSNSARGQQRAADAAAAEQGRQFDLTREDQAPWREAGSNALAQLVSLAGQYGKVPTAAEVMAQPGYQFGLDQGLDAIENRAAAAGGLYSGAAGKELMKFGNDYATGKYMDAFNMKRSAEGDIWNRYAGLADIGQTATNQLAQAGQNYANRVGDIWQNNANAQGAAGIAQANALSNFANQAGSAMRGWWPSTSQVQARFSQTGLGSSGFGTGLAYGNQDLGQYLAEGGPVKPKGYALGGAVAWGGRRLLDDGPSSSPQGEPSVYASDPTVSIPPRPVRTQAIAPPPGKEFTFLPDAEVASPAPMATQQLGTPAYAVPAASGDSGESFPVYRGAYPEWRGAESEGMTLDDHYRRYGSPEQWGQPQQPRSPAWMAQNQQMYADGGRVEPKVGTRAPLRTGESGGGLSRNALLALVQAQQPGPVVVPLPANPLTNPEAILAARLRAAGAYNEGGVVQPNALQALLLREDYTPGGRVDGPGGPKDDAIPAWLSNDEHVFQVEAVKAAGGGSTAKGHQRLNKLREALVKGK